MLPISIQPLIDTNRARLEPKVIHTGSLEGRSRHAWLLTSDSMTGAFQRQESGRRWMALTLPRLTLTSP